MNTNHTQQSILNQQQDESHTPTMKETKENPYMLATWHGYVRFLIRISSMASVVYWQWNVIADRLSSVPEHLRRECSTWIASSFGVEGMIFLFSLERIAETPNHDPLRHHNYHVWGQLITFLISWKGNCFSFYYHYYYYYYYYYYYCFKFEKNSSWVLIES